ncbi:MAG: sigma-70 family RNA polymerase sigma factor [Elusimicrobia bacterium]|nr:sigma-70 family RNA polymerase sigma factor [Elusimicrobiota bacterium]
MDDSGSELIAAAAKGAPEAFKEMVKIHGPRLFSYLAGRLRSREAAEDAYAEVWLKVWKALPAYQSRGRFQPWLFTIAHRLSLDMLERESGRACVSLDAEPADGSAALPERLDSGEPGPEREALARQQWARAAAVLERLPKEQQQTFLLREHGGLSFAEIARVMDCPLSTALARMRYAVLKMREAVEEHHA